MRSDSKAKTLFPEKQLSGIDKAMILNKAKLLEVIGHISKQESIAQLREAVFDLQRGLKYLKADTKGLFNISTNGDTIKLNQKYLFDELNEIIQARTLERCKYYLSRLAKGESWSLGCVN